MEAVMKVARGDGNVRLQQAPEPTPGPGQVLIEVAAAGLCGTDLHIYHDEFPTRPPVILGHEVSGVVRELGEGVAGPSPGTPVTSETYFQTCGSCRYCRDSHPNLCPQRRSIGSGVNGAFAPLLVVPAANLHRLPVGVSLEAGALTEPLACVTHAVLATPTVGPGDIAVVSGPGTIGLLTVQVAAAAGATVVLLGTDVDGERLALARELGAHFVVNVQQESPAELVRDLGAGGHGADVVFECSGAGPAAAGLLELVRRRGRYVQVGLFGRSVSWDLDQVCYKELVVTGSNASTPGSWLRALTLLGEGKVRTEPLVRNGYPLSEWREAFDAFEAKRGVKHLFRPGN